MKIGIFDPYLNDIGGGEKYMITLAECLSQNNDVTVFWDNKDDLDQVSERFSLDVSRITVKNNIFSKNYPFLKRYLDSLNYDAIIVLSDGSIPFVFSKKLFLHFQQPLKELSVKGFRNKIKFSKIAGIFFNSEYTKSFNARILSEIKSTVIYPPISLMTKNVKKENVILHVGRFRVKNVGLSDYKKQNVMIDQFKKMIDRNIIKNWKFVLAVSIKEENKEKFALLQNQAKGYPIEFLINKSNDELWEIYNKAKIYWHASGYGEDLKIHPEYAEHFGISTVEAMGAGCVPVVINAGGQREIVTDKKNGFLWNDLYELQNYTEKLINNQKMWKEMSKHASKRAKDFSKEKFCKEIHELLE